ncbi:MAG: PEP-CTERM system TPR-repeat protein PrsT [Gammaproteobacteria bacterium]|nr:PEP-CTERM system TPR-repeat protein PrsT [Gammaproteobacteria bacterium]
MSTLTLQLRRHLLACAVVAAIVGCGGERTEAEYLSSASTYAADNKHAAAIIEYKNALQQNPRNVDSRLALAASYLVVGDAASAEKELRRAAELGASSEQVLPSLVRALNLQQQHEAIIKETARLDSLPPATRIMLHIARGQAFVSLDREAEARAEFELANELDPQAPLARLGDAYVKVFNDQAEEALAALDTLLADAPALEEAWLLKARLQLARRDVSGAIDSFATLIKLAPQVLGYRLLYAEALLQGERYDEARTELASLRKQIPKHPVPLYYEAVIAFYDKDCDKTLERAGAVLQQLPQHVNSRLLTGYCHYLKGNPELAYEFLRGSAAQMPPEHMARKVLALTEFKLGYHDQAAQTLEDYQGSSAADAELFSNIGGALIREGRAEDAKTLLERAAAQGGSDAVTRARLGMAKLALDDESGLTDLQQVLATDPDNQQTKVLLGLNLLQRNKNDEAKKLADEWLAAEPKNVDAINLSALVARAVGDNARAQTLLDEALTLDPVNRNSHTQLMQMALLAKDIVKAREHIRAVLDPGEVSLPLVELWFGAEQALGDTAKVGDYLAARVAVKPDDASARLALARYRLYQGQPADVEALLSPLKPDAGQYADGQLLRARALLASDKVTEAEKLLRAWRDAQPKDARSYLALAEFYLSQRQLDKAAAEARSGLNEYPKGSALLMMMASIELQRGDLGAAAEQIKILDREQVDNPQADELRARLALAQGRADEALTFAQRSADGQLSATRAALLGQTLVAAGYKDKAREYLEQHLLTSPNNAAARNVLADLYLQTEPDKAIASYRDVLRVQPDNVLALNNLAWLLGERGEVKEAIPLAERANSLFAGNAMVQDTLGALYLKDGDGARALPLIEKASAAMPKDPTIRLHLAEALVATGDKAQAQQILTELKAGPDFGHKAKIDALLEKSR